MARKCGCRKIMELVLTEQGLVRDETIRELEPEDDFASMVGADFSGEIAYDFTVDMKSEDMDGTAYLTVGKLQHSARVLVNGQFAGYMGLKPLALEIAKGLLHPGENQLVLEVANTASNAYGAMDPHQWFDEAHTGPYNDREQNMERERKDGGLYGPVRVEIYR